MWTAMERRQNSFLRKSFPKVDPGSLNRSVRACFDETKGDSLTGEPKELLPDELAIVCCDSAVNVGYGAAGFKKLVQQLGSQYPEIQEAALDVLLTKLSDSLLCRKAIQLGIVSKLSAIMQQEQNRNERKVINALTLLASFESGAREIAAVESLTNKLLTMLEVSSSLFLTLVLHPPILDQFLTSDYLQHLKPIVVTLDAQKNLPLVKLVALLIEQDPEKATNEGYFGILLAKLCTTEPLAIGPWLGCLGCLLSTSQVQKLADKHFIVHSLHRLLRYWRLPETDLKYVALCLQNCTIGHKAKHYCSELWNLPHIFIELAHTKKDERLQLYAINTLKHLAENLRTRKFLNKSLHKQMVRIYCLNEANLVAKGKLMGMLRFGCAYLFKH
jgi:hypothetical protein